MKDAIIHRIVQAVQRHQDVCPYCRTVDEVSQAERALIANAERRQWDSFARRDAR